MSYTVSTSRLDLRHLKTHNLKWSPIHRGQNHTLKFIITNRKLTIYYSSIAFDVVLLVTFLTNVLSHGIQLFDQPYLPTHVFNPSFLWSSENHNHRSPQSRYQRNRLSNWHHELLILLIIRLIKYLSFVASLLTIPNLTRYVTHVLQPQSLISSCYCLFDSVLPPWNCNHLKVLGGFSVPRGWIILQIRVGSIDVIMPWVGVCDNSPYPLILGTEWQYLVQAYYIQSPTVICVLWQSALYNFKYANAILPTSIALHTHLHVLLHLLILSHSFYHCHR